MVLLSRRVDCACSGRVALLGAQRATVLLRRGRVCTSFACPCGNDSACCFVCDPADLCISVSV